MSYTKSIDTKMVNDVQLIWSFARGDPNVEGISFGLRPTSKRIFFSLLALIWDKNKVKMWTMKSTHTQ